MRHHVFESTKRSILKAVSWKLFATATSFCVTFVQTGDAGQSAKISGIIAIVGLIGYFIHERLWNQIHWEKKVEHNHPSV